MCIFSVVILLFVQQVHTQAPVLVQVGKADQV